MVIIKHRVETFLSFLEKKFPFGLDETIYLCYNVIVAAGL